MKENNDHIDWCIKQIAEKEKQLEKHRELKRIYEGKDCGVDLDELINDDTKYIMLLKYSLENALWYKDRG